jgi:hypothetical protein
MSIDPSLALADWTPRELPTAEPLVGARVTLVPTDVTQHALGLFEATRAGDPALWDYLPWGPFPDEAVFEQWLAPDNFDADGDQLQRLDEIRSGKQV